MHHRIYGKQYLAIRLSLAFAALTFLAGCWEREKLPGFFKVELHGETGLIFGAESYSFNAKSQTWERLSVDFVGDDDYFPFDLRDSVQFINPKIGFYSMAETLLRTTDGGKTWEQVGTRSAQPRSFFFRDAVLGFGISRGFLYRTADGGSSWQKILNTDQFRREHSATMYGFGFRSLCFGQGESVYLLAFDTLFESQDLGGTWQEILRLDRPALTVRRRVDDLWILGMEGLCTVYSLSQQESRSCSFSTTSTLYDIAEEDQLVVVVGEDGAIFVSRDGGRTWSDQSLKVAEDLVSVAVNQDGLAIAVGGHANIGLFQVFGRIVLISRDLVTWKRVKVSRS